METTLIFRITDQLVTFHLFRKLLIKLLSINVYVYVYVYENFILLDCQSAYRRFSSTETALLKVQNDILLNMDMQEVTLLVLLYLCAAFDTVDHSLILNALQGDCSCMVSVLLIE